MVDKIAPAKNKRIVGNPSLAKETSLYLTPVIFYEAAFTPININKTAFILPGANIRKIIFRRN
jgi:hypothetical protein